MIIVGWDVSTSAIGICMMTLDGEIIGYDVIFPKGETHPEKHVDAAEQVMGKVAWICGNTDIGNGDLVHVIEENLGGFSGGMTSSQTLMALAAMNAVITFVLHGMGKKTIKVLPVSAKRICKLAKLPGEDKKQAVVRWARDKDPSFPYEETAAGNPRKGTDDQADALLLAEAGRKIELGEAVLKVDKKEPKKPKEPKLGQPKKTPSGRSKARPAKGDGSPQG